MALKVFPQFLQRLYGTHTSLVFGRAFLSSGGMSSRMVARSHVFNTVKSSKLPQPTSLLRSCQQLCFRKPVSMLPTRGLCCVSKNYVQHSKLLKIASHDATYSSPKRNITLVSRLGKRKSCKAVLKRFRRVQGGYLKRWRAGKTHLMRKKSSRRRYRLRGSVLVKNKVHLKVLNKMIDALSDEVVDLDRPPKDRWEHIVKPRRKQIEDFRDYLKHLITPVIFDWISKKVAVDGLGKLPKEFADEIEGIANHLDMPVGDILIGNIFYELEKLCTSIVAQDSEGHVYHARNLDLGSWLGWDKKKKGWKITDLIQPLAVNVEFISKGKTVFKSVQYVGTVGVFTGVRPGKYSFSLNSRDPEHRFGGPISILKWLHTSYDDHHFASFLARKVLQTAHSYNRAKKLLSKKPLMAPVYYILAGSRKNQGIIISRSKTGSDRPLELSDERPFLVQTNYDHWLSAPFYDDRRTPATKCLKKAVAAENGFEVQAEQVQLIGCYISATDAGRNTVHPFMLSLESLYNILSTMPILNKATVYSTLMDPKVGVMKSYRRYCPGNCYPW